MSKGYCHGRILGKVPYEIDIMLFRIEDNSVKTVTVIISERRQVESRTAGKCHGQIRFTVPTS